MYKARRMKKNVIAAVVLFVLVVGTAQAAFIVTRQGKKISGSNIRMKNNGDVILTTSKGPLTFVKGSYVKAVADEPVEYKQAMRLASAGKYDRSIKLLAGIVASYKGLQWDNKARVALAQVFAQKQDYAGALKAYEELFRTSPKSKEIPEVIWPYRETLLLTKKYALLEPDLNKVIKADDRAEAARAQIMRGDLRRSQNQTEPAVMDYMRTMVFFKDVPEYQAEAMYKAAEGLEAMRDDRAKGIYRSLVEKYPDSPYASKAKSKR